MIKLTSILRENINSYILRENDFTLGTDDLELAKDFNVKYLTVGDTVTPEMWDLDSLRNRTNYDWYLKSHEITRFGNWGPDSIVEFDGDLFYGWDWVSNHLKPQYQIEAPLEESFELSDDDLEMAKDFNVKELGVGDTITPEMWDREKIESLFMFSSAERILFQYNWKIIGFNEFGNIKFRINKKYNRLYSVGFINACLKSKYQIEVPLYESFELGDTDMELAKKFNGEIWDGGTIDEYEEWAEPILINAGFKENDIQDYMMDVANTGIEEYENITSKELLDDFKNWKYDESVFDDEDEDLDESFELGNEDFELAKGFNIVYLKEGDIVTPDMWDEKKCNDMGINYSYLTRESWTIESFDHINEPQIGEVFWLVVLKGNSSGIIDDDMEEDVANEILKNNYRFDIPLDAPDRVNEEFELGDEDIKLASRLNHDPQYDLVLEIVESYEDEEILQDFLNTFPVGEHISEEEFKDFFAKYVDDYGDWFYIKQNWKYVESGGDESVYDEEEDDDEDELNEEFTLDTTDFELAKGFQNFDIIVKIIDTYESYSKNNTKKNFDRITIINTNKQIIEDILGYPISKNPQEIKNILYNELRENDLDLEDLGNNKIVKEIPKGWITAFLTNTDIEVEIPDSLNESFELGDDDLELAKSFSPNPDIQVDVHVIYDFGGSQEELEHETTFRFLFKLPDLIEFIDEEGYENITETDIVDNLDSEWLDDLILDTMNYHSLNHSDIEKDTIWNNDTWFEENCSKVLNPVDWSKVPYGTEPKKRELDITIDLLDPSKKVNETFELSDDDLELAKDFNIKELKPGDTIEPEMWNDFFGDDLQTRSAYISNIYDDEDGEVVTLHQNGYDFDFDLEDINDYLKPKYRIIDSLDESFELGDEDIELAKGFNQKELKVGNVFNEYIGKVWDSVKDISEQEFKDNIVGLYEIIYIGPNEGKYHTPSYHHWDIVVVRSLFDTQHTEFTFTAEHFNETRGPKLNAYIPTKDNIDETFERGPEDIELANGLYVVKYLEVGDVINSDMWDPTNSDLKDFIGSRDEKWTIDMIKGNHLLLSTEMGDEINTDIDTFNSLLKPEYIIE